MEYQNAINYGYSNAQHTYGGSIGGSAIGGITVPTPEAPRTIASASSRLEALNERLAKASEALSMVCSQIGALSALNQIGRGAADGSVAGGAVHRLNDAADEAHSRLLAIENYIASIQRALG